MLNLVTNFMLDNYELGLLNCYLRVVSCKNFMKYEILGLFDDLRVSLKNGGLSGANFYV